MEPERDELDDRLARAAAVEDELVDRVVAGALAERRRRRWAVPLGVAAALILGTAAVGFWWADRHAEVEPLAVPRVTVRQVALPPPAGHVSVRQVSVARRGEIIALRAEDGTTWILSTTKSADLPPRGTSIVIPEGETR